MTKLRLLLIMKMKTFSAIFALSLSMKMMTILFFATFATQGLIKNAMVVSYSKVYLLEIGFVRDAKF